MKETDPANVDSGSAIFKKSALIPECSEKVTRQMPQECTGFLVGDADYYEDSVNILAFREKSGYNL